MEEKNISPEKRVFRRIPAELPLRVFNLSSPKWRLLKTQDISAQGIGLLAEEEMAPGEALEMWLAIPDSAEPLYSKGEVAWARQLQGAKYRVGVYLEKPDLIYRILQEESLSISSPLLKSLAF